MTILYDLLTQERVVGGGIILGVDDMLQRAMPITKVEVILDNWLILYCPWQAVREGPNEDWQFWQDSCSHSISGDLEVYARQTDDSQFKILLEGISDTGFTWRPRSTRKPVINASFNTIYYDGYFPISTIDVDDMPKDLTDPGSWSAPTLTLGPNVWKGLIGYNDIESQELYNKIEFDPDEVLHLLPRCCADISYLRDVLSSIFDRGGVMTPFDLESLRESIDNVLASHSFDFSTESQEVFATIKAQLAQMPTYT